MYFQPLSVILNEMQLGLYLKYWLFTANLVVVYNHHIFKETRKKLPSEIKCTRIGRVRGIYAVNRVIHTPKAHGTQKPR